MGECFRVGGSYIDMASTIEMMQRSIRNSPDLNNVVLGAKSANQGGRRLCAVNPRIFGRIEPQVRYSLAFFSFKRSFTIGIARNSVSKLR